MRSKARVVVCVLLCVMYCVAVFAQDEEPATHAHGTSCINASPIGMSDEPGSVEDGKRDR